MESGQLNVLTPMRYTIKINEWSQAIMDTSIFKWEEKKKTIEISIYIYMFYHISIAANHWIILSLGLSPTIYIYTLGE